LERADFSKPAVVKKMLWNYDSLMKLALKGDSVARDICITLKIAVHTDGVLTFKQRRYLSLWWQGFSLTEIAAMYHIAPKNVYARICAGLRNISKYLMEGGKNDPCFVDTIKKGEFA
jgi:hypothetical protein